MKQEEIWDADVAAGYDTPGTGVFAPEVVGPAVERLAALAGNGRSGSELTAESRSHVSVYRIPPGREPGHPR